MDNLNKIYTKKLEWLKTKFKRIWNSEKFCGLCFEESHNLCPLSIEFVVSKQKSSISFIDLLNYVFNQDVENIAATSGICESCTEKALQAYIFIHNTRQISQIMNECVSDIYSKVLDISEQIDEKIDCENANIMIILETEADLYEQFNDFNNTEIVPTNTPRILDRQEVSPPVSIKQENRCNREAVEDLNRVTTNSDKANKLEVNTDLTNPERKFDDSIQLQGKIVEANVFDKNNFEFNDEICTSDVENLNENHESSNVKVKVKPEIYLKGGNIVIKPMKMNNNSSLTINTYKCHQCSEIFTSYRTLKEHEKAKHKKVVYQCNFCTKKYNTLQYLNIHYKTHSKAICKICQAVLPEASLMRHLRVKHAAAIQVHPCKFCELVYYSEQALETHFKAVHLANSIKSKQESKNYCVMCLRNISDVEIKIHKCKFQCSECMVMPCIHFRYLTCFREQILNHSAKIKCIDCDYVTKRKEYLISHANREHLDHHPFTCNDCGTQFYTKMSMRIHIDQFHNTFNICQYCDVEFKKNFRLVDHRNICKNITRPFACGKCVATFDTETKLTNHDSLRHNEDGYPCSMCKRRFLTNLQLEEHQVTSHSKIQCKKRRKNIDCTICDIKFKSVKELLQHESVHGPGIKYPCRVCSKQFYSLKKLYIHKQRHYERIQCSGCKKRVITAFYPQHEVRCPYKRNITLSHVCETCGKAFHLESLLRFHQKIHMEPIPCPECNKMFKPTGIKRHIETVHSGKCSGKLLTDIKDKPTNDTGSLECPICGHSVRRKYNLEAHMNRYHLKVKPFTCHICNKEFCGVTRLKEHVMTHSKKNTCFCTVCGKKFANRVCLKLHFRMHTGETPYSCDVCGEKFRTSSIMKTHRIKKHLEKSVSCPLCDSMFYMIRDMRHHFKKVHWKDKDKPFNVREVLPEKYYHLFEDGRLAKITDEIIETEIVKTDIEIVD